MYLVKPLRLGAASAVCALALFAADFWKTKDSSQWSSEEINKILSDSPWAKAKTVQPQQSMPQRGMGRRGGFGYPGGGYPGGGGGYPGGGGGYPGGGGGRRGPETTSANGQDGKKNMEKIAARTGGRFFEAKKKDNLDEIYGQIAEELRGQYLLTYTPDKADTDGGYHKIALKASKDDLLVVTREGYYAPGGDTK